MENENLTLIDPTEELESEYLAMHRECQEHPDPYTSYALSPAPTDFPAFVQKLKNEAEGIGLPEGYVPQSNYWLVRNGRELIGEIRLRHRLTPALEDFGGNIGYMIRPTERRKGYGTLMLRMVLEKAREIGLARALVSCDPANVGSAKVIRNNGGVLASEGISREMGQHVSRYWIQL